MPHFTFLLTNPHLRFEVQKESERWSLSFDAKVEPERFGTFRIFFDGREYNGYKMNGKAFIECRHSKNESEQLSLRQPEDRNVSTEERPGYLHVATIPPEYQDSESVWPRIGIVASLPFYSFFRLHQASVNAPSIELYAHISGPNKEASALGQILMVGT